jgi:Putative auto-transporter adhesin, head GIN domain
MNKRFFLVALVLIALLTVSQATAFSFSRGIKGSGEMETRELDLDTFTAISMGGAFDLDIRLGDRQRVEVTIDDNLWKAFEAEVNGDWLSLDWSESVRCDGDCRVEITVKSLEEISINGAGDVDISDFEGREFTYRLSGAGNLEMDGEVDSLEIRISGAGKADTTDLIAKDVKVQISGAGNASVYAAESIHGRISGVGNLTYYGDPEDENTKVSGLGKIRRK